MGAMEGLTEFIERSRPAPVCVSAEEVISTAESCGLTAIVEEREYRPGKQISVKRGEKEEHVYIDDNGDVKVKVEWVVARFEDRAVIFEPRCNDLHLGELLFETFAALGLEGTARVETPERIVRVPVPPWVQLNALEPWNAEVVSVFQFESEAREGLLAYHKQATEILREDPVVRDFLERRLIGPLDGHYGTVSLDEREEKWFK